MERAFHEELQRISGVFAESSKQTEQSVSEIRQHTSAFTTISSTVEQLVGRSPCSPGLFVMRTCVVQESSMHAEIVHLQNTVSSFGAELDEVL